MAPDALTFAGGGRPTFKCLKEWLKPRADLAGDEFSKKQGNSLGFATIAGAILAYAALATPLRDTVFASLSWLTTVLLVM